MMRSPGHVVRPWRRSLGAALALALLVSLVPVAGAVRSFRLSLPSGGVPAGNEITATVDALDQFFSLDSTYVGTVSLTSTDPQATIQCRGAAAWVTMPATCTFLASDHGSLPARAAFRTVGHQSLTVTDVANPAAYGYDSVDVVPAAASGLAWIQYPTSGTAGVVFASEPQVRVIDAFRNTVTTGSYQIGLEVWYAGTSGSSGLACPGGLARNTTGGTASFSGCSMSAPGTWEIRAASPGLTPATGGYITIGAGSGSGATYLTLITDSPPAGWVVGTSYSFGVTAAAPGPVLDPSYRGTLHFTCTDPAATLPADYTFTAADAGHRSFSITFGTPGSQMITATDVSHSTITGSTGYLNVVGSGPPPGGASTLQLTPVPATINLHDFTLLKIGFTTPGAGAGATIGVFWAYVGSDDWYRVTTLTASAAGDASYSDNPGANVDYRAVCEAGCPGGAASITSNRATVRVRHAVALTPSTSGVRIVTAGTRLTYTATATPATAGDRPSVTFLLYQKVRGAWVLRTQRTVLASAAGAARFAYSFSTRGEWYIRARVPTDAYNASNQSPIRRIRVV